MFADVAAGESEADFNEWYDQDHLAEVLGVLGFVAATRYRRLEPVEATGPIDQRYLSIYEVESDDLHAVQQALAAAAPKMNISAALSRDPRPVVMWFNEVAERRTA